MNSKFATKLDLNQPKTKEIDLIEHRVTLDDSYFNLLGLGSDPKEYRYLNIEGEVRTAEGHMNSKVNLSVLLYLSFRARPIDILYCLIRHGL